MNKQRCLHLNLVSARCSIGALWHGRQMALHKKARIRPVIFRTLISEIHLSGPLMGIGNGHALGCAGFGGQRPPLSGSAGCLCTSGVLCLC